jgi:hypothetical protein
MKYLSALKEENPPDEEIEKSKNPYHDELQKVQKAPFRAKNNLFTVFAVREGDTSQKKPEQEKVEDNPIRAKGYGCVCGHNLYQQVEDFVEEPEDDNWEHQYRFCKVWQCENCKAIYEIIGGTKGPQYMN